MQGVLEGGSVMLAEHIRPNLQNVVRADSQYLRIKGPVVNGTHCDTIWNDRFPAIGVLPDMSSLEELGKLESAECAPVPVSGKNVLPENALVKPTLDESLSVLSTQGQIRGVLERAGHPVASRQLIQCHDELLMPRLLFDEPNRRNRDVCSWSNSIEPDELLAKRHSAPKGDVSTPGED